MKYVREDELREVVLGLCYKEHITCDKCPFEFEWMCKLRQAVLGLPNVEEDER